MIIKFIKRLFCKHEKGETITNFYGDYINLVSTHKHTYRSCYRCESCGKIIYREFLDYKCKVINFNIV